jgi:hypothetical protein
MTTDRLVTMTAMDWAKTTGREQVSNRRDAFPKDCIPCR